MSKTLCYLPVNHFGMEPPRFSPGPKRQVNLERVIQESCEEELNGLVIDLTEDDEEVLESTKDNKVAVYLRLRPHPNTDRTKYEVRDNSFVVLCEETTNKFKKKIDEKHFSFSKVFGNAVTQSEIFENCVRANLNVATTDAGTTFLTYGTSGSGKTFTLLGDANDPGIVSRSIEQIFSQYSSYISKRPMVKIEKQCEKEVSILSDIAVENENTLTQYIVEQVSMNYNQLQEKIQSQHLFEKYSDPDISCMNIWISFVEIYNETVRDLLGDTNRQNLRIISNDGESFIKDVQWVFAPTAQACHSILEYGQLRASYNSTAINNYSSRSHCVFYINVVTITKDNEVAYSIFKFCDLAGSERIKKAETQGDRLNKSLMTLGRCLSAVHANQKANRVVEIVPIRDSKLTLLIQAALTSLERLTMIVNLLPVAEYFDENLNVLAFSSIAKQIHVRKAETRMAKRQSMRFSHSISALTSPTTVRIDHVECEMERERMQEKIEQYKKEVRLRLEDYENLSQKFEALEELYKVIMKQNKDLEEENQKIKNKNKKLEELMYQKK